MYRRSLLAAALSAAPLAVARGQDYPSRPVRLSSASRRAAAPIWWRGRSRQGAQAALGQSLVVDNRGGANGSVGLEVVAKSPADGYTLGHVNSSVVVTNPLLYRNHTVVVARDLVPICTVADSAVVLAVPADLPAKDLRELVALAKSKPGELHFGSGGLGSVDHLAFEVVKQQTGVDFLHVPYRGGGPALNDMLGGRVQLMISSYGMYKGQVDAGKVRIVAILGRTRHPALPDVPTGIEQGWPESSRHLVAGRGRAGRHGTGHPRQGGGRLPPGRVPAGDEEADGKPGLFPGLPRTGGSGGPAARRYGEVVGDHRRA